MSRIKDFLRSEEGPTATEYAVVLAGIIVVAIGTITSLGSTVKAVMDHTNTHLAAVPGGS